MRERVLALPLRQRTNDIEAAQIEGTPLQRRLAVGTGARAAQGEASAPSSAMPIQMFADAVSAGLHLRVVQLDGMGGGLSADDVHRAAAHGLSGSGGALPHLAAIQRAFGRHDVSGVKAHVGGTAAEGSAAMGARAYAAGNQIAFAASPDLHLAAHEAAHVVQQRGGVQLSGGVGTAGDLYEQHADAVADLVTRGDSAEALLDQHAPASAGGSDIQRTVQLTPDECSADPATAAPVCAPTGEEEAEVEALAALHEVVPEVRDELPPPPPPASAARSRRHGGTASTASTASAPTASRRGDTPIEHQIRDQFAIPAHGYDDHNPLGARTVDLNRDLRTVVRRIHDEPAVLDHIRHTLDAFYNDPDPASRLTPDQIDISLVLAIATRESSHRYMPSLLEDSGRQVVSAGPDTYRGGHGGLDYVGGHRDLMPSTMRGDTTAVHGSARLSGGLIRPQANPLELPEGDLLAAYIVEVRARQQTFDHRVRRYEEHGHSRPLLTSEQADQLLARLSRPARRAWTQAAFGSRLGPLLTTVLERFRHAMHGDAGFGGALADDSVNLNSIATDFSITDAQELSGHRVHITMAEAAMLDRMLPTELGGEGETAPTEPAVPTGPTAPPSPSLPGRSP